MDRIILDSIPFEADEKGLMDMLRIRAGTRSASEFPEVLKEAARVARPRAAFAVANADLVGHDTVGIGGTVFRSRVLRVNLEEAGVVFPFVATCGTEMEEWSRSMSGSLRAFWADSLMLVALGCAVACLEDLLRKRLGTPALSSMNPGSLPDWPLEEQAPLFSLLGEAAAAIGVRLTDSMVIRPLKSVSGISFVSEKGFTNCSLCPRENCPSRRAAYDAALYARDY